MLKCKFALVFLVVLAVYLQQTQGHPHTNKKGIKLPVVATKVGLAKSFAAKVKLAAYKKWIAAKSIAKFPFVLGKKAALFKIGAVKSLAAYKLAKGKKLFGFASKKVKPSLAVVAGLPTKFLTALKPKPEPVMVYQLPNHYGAGQQNAHFGSEIVSSYKDASGTPKTYSSGYSVSLLPEGEVSNQYQYQTVNVPESLVLLHRRSDESADVEAVGA